MRLTWAACENHPFCIENSMDVEHINAIGHLLADLTQRTLALRGYL